MKYIITVSGEIVLKSRRSRPRFFRKLLSNIDDALKRRNVKNYSAEISGAKIFLEVNQEIDNILERIFGIYRYGKAAEFTFIDVKDLAEKIANAAKEEVEGRTFAVRVNRVGNHPFTSMDVAREAGALLYPHSRGVNLTEPEVTVWVEVRWDKAFVYQSRKKGPGGLPIGIEGRGLALFSGGLDSPVAAWYAAKRGVEVHFLHFFMGSSYATYLAVKAAQKLANDWLHGYEPKLYVADLTDLIKEITDKVSGSHRQIVLRSLMYIISMKLAEKKGYDTIITGEALGQASSQTLQNLRAIHQVVKPYIPLIRPLVGFDKEEVVELSRKIGMYEISSKVPEVCSISQGLVATRAKPKTLAGELGKINTEVIKEIISSIRIYDLRTTNPAKVIEVSGIEIDFIPEDALIIDVRTSKQGDMPEGIIHISEVSLNELPKNRPVLFVCNSGMISYLKAMEARKLGIQAYSLRGGIRILSNLLKNRTK